jgi:hypothetical protein
MLCRSENGHHVDLNLKQHPNADTCPNVSVPGMAQKV